MSSLISMFLIYITLVTLICFAIDSICIFPQKNFSIIHLFEHEFILYRYLTIMCS